MGRPPRPIEERFWEKVDIRGKDECWEWKSKIGRDGYGRITEKGKSVIAHRMSWVLTFGEIPEHDSYHGMCVLHTCDNPPCVNPNHLFLGTAKDNMDDMWNKGRANPHRIGIGEDHPRAKLTKEKVNKIRELYSTGKYTYLELGKRFGVTKAGITNVILRRTWKHI